MQIADRPSKPRGIRGIRVESNFKHRLEFLRDPIHSRAGLKNNRRVLQRYIEIETKFAAILRDSAPAPLCEREAIDGHAEFWKGVIPLGKRGANDVHVRG